MEKNSIVDFKALEKELQAALDADEKYKRENAAKLRAVAQRVPSYEDFRSAPCRSGGPWGGEHRGLLPGPSLCPSVIFCMLLSLRASVLHLSG